MNPFWVKLAGVVVLVVAAVVVVGRFVGSKEGEEPKREKTIHEVWQADEERLRAEPVAPAEPSGGQEGTAAQQPKPLKFKELTEEQEVHAEQLFELALAQRKMGRLPMVNYKLMVQYCRQIIELYPGSEYAYKAKRMLADLPERERERYDITDEEIDLSQ